MTRSQPAVGLSYLHDPAAIYRHSFATIEREADLSRFDGAMRDVAIRMIHACGMVDLADDIVFSHDAGRIGQEALQSGAAIFCDAEMVRQGIIASRLPGNNRLVSLIADPAVACLARQRETTRSAAQVDLWGDDIAGAVIVIGNAPTALFRLLERLEGGAPEPALILACPVGFVGAQESKAALVANLHGLPFITVAGRRGGSAIAAAALNAMAGRGP